MPHPARRPVIMRLTLALAIGLSCLTGFVPAASAQLSATVTPSLLELQADPGATGEQTIAMRIDGSEDATVNAELSAYPTTVSVPSAVEWLSLDTTEQGVSAGDEASFTLAIAIPDDASTGGHYAAVTLTVGAAGAATVTAGESQASVQGRFIVPVLIRVGDPDDYVRTADLGRFAPVLEQDGRIGVWGELTNTGNVDLTAPGTASIADASGDSVAELDFPETTPILPGETQIVRATGTLPLPEGNDYTVTGAIDYGGDDEAQAETTFSLTAAAPTGELAICENLDRGPTVSLHLANGGSIGLATSVSLAINDDAGNQVVSTTLPDLTLIWPGEGQDVATDAPARLESGSYTLVAQILTGADDVTTIELPFDIGGASDLTAPLCPAART